MKFINLNIQIMFPCPFVTSYDTMGRWKSFNESVKPIKKTVRKHFSSRVWNVLFPRLSPLSQVLRAAEPLRAYQVKPSQEEEESSHNSAIRQCETFPLSNQQAAVINDKILNYLQQSRKISNMPNNNKNPTTADIYNTLTRAVVDRMLGYLLVFSPLTSIQPKR